MIYLYLITCENEDGETLDLCVAAERPEQAFELWRQHWIDFFENDGFAFSGEIVSGPPGSRYTEEAARIFLIQGTGKSGVLGWDMPETAGSLRLIGYVLP